MSRRKFLKLAGSGIGIVVVGGTVWRAFSNGVFSSGQGPAYEPWKDWKTESRRSRTFIASSICYPGRQMHITLSLGYLL